MEIKGSLTLNGPLQVKDGTQAVGRILVSDISGSSSWQPPVVFVDLVTPVGLIDGVNKVFVLPSTPTAGLHLYVNGILQNPGIGNDYTASLATITFSIAPSTASTILASYRI